MRYTHIVVDAVNTKYGLSSNTPKSSYSANSQVHVLFVTVRDHGWIKKISYNTVTRVSFLDLGYLSKIMIIKIVSLTWNITLDLSFIEILRSRDFTSIFWWNWLSCTTEDPHFKIQGRTWSRNRITVFRNRNRVVTSTNVSMRTVQKEKWLCIQWRSLLWLEYKDRKMYNSAKQ